MVAIWIPAIGKADASWVTGTISHMSYRGKIYCVVPEKRNREYCVCRVSDKESEFKSSYYIVETKEEEETAEEEEEMAEGMAEEAGEGEADTPMAEPEEEAVEAAE